MKRINLKNLLVTATIASLFGASVFNFALANPSDITSSLSNISIDGKQIKHDFSAVVLSGSLKISFATSTLSAPSEIQAEEISDPIPTPWNLERLSPIYQYDLKNKAAYSGKLPFKLEIKYDIASKYLKQAYYYDKDKQTWKALPTIDIPAESKVKINIHLPFARIAIFADEEKLSIGQASWYDYKKGLFCASPDYPQGTNLRVYNNDNNKYVDVVVNDFGPDRKLHPDRVIDLDKTAFLKLAKTGQGVINIRVEPLGKITDTKAIVKTVAPILPAATAHLAIKSKSALVISEKTGSVIWQKNSSQQLPLASLTKLVAIKVFLDTKPPLDKVVAYKTIDEEYNYQYCEKWESARLRLKEGDTLTVKDLLYASLIGSANNSIETLVRVSGMTRQDFISTMNKTVSLWGAKSTYFVEPTGLAPENVSSAEDYAIITKKVFTNPLIEKISSTSSYKFSTINTKQAHSLKNTSQLITSSSGNFNIAGSKTGYLDEAGYCLMTRVKNKQGDYLIAITMGADSKAQSIKETSDLLQYGLIQLKKK